MRIGKSTSTFIKYFIKYKHACKVKVVWPTRKETKVKLLFWPKLALRLLLVGRRKYTEYEVRRISVIRFRLWSLRIRGVLRFERQSGIDWCGLVATFYTQMLHYSKRKRKSAQFIDYFAKLLKFTDMRRTNRSFNRKTCKRSIVIVARNFCLNEKNIDHKFQTKSVCFSIILFKP